MVVKNKRVAIMVGERDEVARGANLAILWQVREVNGELKQ